MAHGTYLVKVGCFIASLGNQNQSPPVFEKPNGFSLALEFKV